MILRQKRDKFTKNFATGIRYVVFAEERSIKIEIYFIIVIDSCKMTRFSQDHRIVDNSFIVLYEPVTICLALDFCESVLMACLM
jgi:hypothetical protein